MSPGLFLLAARLALAAVFALAGLAKLRDMLGSRKSLAEFGVPAVLTPALAVLLPVAELACALALLRDRWAVPGAIGATSLLAVFTAGIAVSLARGRAPVCHCFGELSSSPVSWRTLVRNVILVAVACDVAWQADRFPSVWPALSGNSFETFVIVALFALAAVIVLTLWLLFHMLQQSGRLLLRLEVVERKLNIIPDTNPVQGLRVGSPAPAFSLNTLGGGTTDLRSLWDSRKTILLVFSEPGCRVCVALLPEVLLWQNQYAEHLMIIPVSRGEVKLNRSKFAGLGGLLLQGDREAEQAYQISATPSAVLVAGGRIASPIAAGPDAIRALVARATLPPPVKKGDVVPSVKLRDLTGGATDLGTLRGRRTMLLFWNPACGFCQKMLPAVKAWKDPENGPELVVISKGSAEDTRDQALSAKVLLDPNFSAGQVFGATGTPSAVVLDEDGLVASDVGTGAAAVFALAGVPAPEGWA